MLGHPAAQNIAREKELRTIEQLNVTPITRAEFITAKLLPFWVLGLLDLTRGLIVGRLVFGVPVRGSLLLLFASAGVYLVVALSIESLVGVVEGLHGDPSDLPRAASVAVGAAALLAAWGVFIRLNKTVEELEPEGMNEAKREDAKVQ